MFIQPDFYFFLIPLFVGLILDFIFGDPRKLPHIIVGFGNLIYLFESKLNNGSFRFWKGAFTTIILSLCIFFASYFLLTFFQTYFFDILYYLTASILVFYCLSHKSLLQEGQEVLDELENKGIEKGRKRLSWIVGRDTSNLSANEIRKAVFETVSENLSDGVIAPIFWYSIAGVPGMLCYKMVNTLDSMIGYKSERYKLFGCFVAKCDDVLNFIPARITAFLMIIVSFSLRGFKFIIKYGNKHSSPNSGYPESALAGILNCRFGGPNIYHGLIVEKPYIGYNDREIKTIEYKKVKKVNHKVTILTFFTIVIISLIILQ